MKDGVLTIMKENDKIKIYNYIESKMLSFVQSRINRTVDYDTEFSEEFFIKLEDEFNQRFAVNKHRFYVYYKSGHNAEVTYEDFCKQYLESTGFRKMYSTGLEWYLFLSDDAFCSFCNGHGRWIFNEDNNDKCFRISPKAYNGGSVWLIYFYLEDYLPQKPKQVPQTNSPLSEMVYGYWILVPALFLSLNDDEILKWLPCLLTSFMYHARNSKLKMTGDDSLLDLILHGNTQKATRAGEIKSKAIPIVFRDEMKRVPSKFLMFFSNPSPEFKIFSQAEEKRSDYFRTCAAIRKKTANKDCALLTAVFCSWFDVFYELSNCSDATFAEICKKVDLEENISLFMDYTQLKRPIFIEHFDSIRAREERPSYGYISSIFEKYSDYCDYENDSI